MEIKDNKLIIDIPKGMEVDVKNTDLTKGIVKFKKKIKEYHDIFGALVKKLYYSSYGLETSNADKLIALDKLMNIAKYYNGDWKPEWNNRNEEKIISITAIPKMSIMLMMLILIIMALSTSRIKQTLRR